MPELPLDPREAQFGEQLKAVLGERSELVNRLLVQIFPRLSESSSTTKYDFAEGRRERRVFAPDAFDAYFGLKLTPDAIGSAEMEGYLAVLRNEQEFREELLRLAASKRTDGSTRAEAVLDRFLDYADDPRLGELAIPLLDVVLREGNALIRADEERVRSGFGIELTVSRLLFQLLPRISAPERSHLFLDALGNGRSLGATVLQLFRLAEHDGSVGGTGKELFSESDMERLKTAAVQRIEQQAADETLLEDPMLPFVLYRWRDWGRPAHVAEWMHREAERDVTRLLRRWYDAAGRFEPAELAELGSLQALFERATDERWRDPSDIDQADAVLLDRFLEAVSPSVSKGEAET